jgi:hypothetical protein
MTHSIERIEPTEENAIIVLNLTAEDLRNAELGESEVARIADASNPEHVQVQREKLRKNPERYMGAIASGAVVAFRKVNEWYTGDQEPYAGQLERVEIARWARRNNHHMPGRPLGIFALSVSSSLEGSDSSLAIARSLMDGVLVMQGRKDIRVGLHDNDPLAPLLRDEYGFIPTGKYGDPLGAPLQLHVRPPVGHRER